MKFLALLLAVAAHAQVFDAGQAGVPIQIPADAGWRFHDVAYEELAFSLGPDKMLTMLTDGVLEATNEKGEMLGFERPPQLTAKSAPEIAEAARTWGQNDDISVVKIGWPAP